MTFGVNGLRLAGQRLGIGRYIEYLFKDWDTMLVPGERFVVYVREPFDKNELGLSDAFEVRVLRSRFQGMAWEHLVLAKHARETDVLFCPSYTVPLHYRGRLVVATHSVNEAESGTHPWWYHLTYRQRNKASARRADAVIVPSETTKGHVEAIYGVPSDRITIVPEGAPDSFAPVTDQAVLAETRRRYLGDDVPYVLFVGKQSLRRNIPALIEAFGRVKRSEGIPHKLLLFGPNVEDLPLAELESQHGVVGSIVQTDGRIGRHEEILPVYSGADLFVHPTAAEGFSLTIVEAMACGLPVVTVGRGAVAEIVDGAALTVADPTPDLLEAALRRTLTDASLRAELGAKAIERSRMFRLSRTAKGTLDVMRRVAAQ